MPRLHGDRHTALVWAHVAQLHTRTRPRACRAHGRGSCKRARAICQAGIDLRVLCASMGFVESAVLIAWNAALLATRGLELYAPSEPTAIDASLSTILLYCTPARLRLLTTRLLTTATAGGHARAVLWPTLPVGRNHAHPLSVGFDVTIDPLT